MNMENKKGIRWWIFRWFGPQEVQNLINYIDEMQNSAPESTDIVIFPTGEYEFNVKTSKDDDLEPLIFRTQVERAAFQVGLSYGVRLMGGTTAALSEEEFEALDSMQKKTTHGGGGHRNN